MYESLAIVLAAAHFAAALSLLNGLLTVFGQAKIAATAIESIARQPEAADSIRGIMFVGLAMGETSGIYGLLIAIIMLFANPLVDIFVRMLG
ncbi:MAG: ATP synthase F0 subunit C [Limnochordia bacterium]|nr:ATP synthase F0 subunit C [Bacillota bacterium]HOB10005.1 ATP synthase F0 subunit C [Limnochordia bacterium]NLH30725.1 ATP synthase F0 subunit C [Bacillota bacterium]HPZ32004.1 ATP synthase F0 subunit C [Limnochordia bacterium]HQD71725.1 ATP synthase F0 subunit C [Limnochordia bacterium]